MRETWSAEDPHPAPVSRVSGGCGSNVVPRPKTIPRPTRFCVEQFWCKIADRMLKNSVVSCSVGPATWPFCQYCGFGLTGGSGWFLSHLYRGYPSDADFYALVHRSFAVTSYLSHLRSHLLTLILISSARAWNFPLCQRRHRSWSGALLIWSSAILIVWLRIQMIGAVLTHYWTHRLQGRPSPKRMMHSPYFRFPHVFVRQISDDRFSNF